MAKRSPMQLEALIEKADADEIGYIVFTALTRMGETGEAARAALQKHVEFARACDEKTLASYEAGWAMVCL